MMNGQLLQRNRAGVLSAFTLIVIAVAGALTLAGARSEAMQDAETLFDPTGAPILARVRIIQWDDTVARFDSATGAIHRFSGDLYKPSVRGQWREEVPPVREATSGMLRFQQPEGVHAIDAPFLVDLVTGETWILRRRGNGGTWDNVEIAP